jgi:hypothetical protein
MRVALNRHDWWVLSTTDLGWRFAEAQESLRMETCRVVEVAQGTGSAAGR